MSSCFPSFFLNVYQRLRVNFLPVKMMSKKDEIRIESPLSHFPSIALAVK